MLKLVLPLLVLTLVPCRAPAHEGPEKSLSPSAEAALTVVRAATFAHPVDALSLRQDILALPPQGPEFTVRALDILLSNPAKWRPYREPRESVLEKIGESLRLLADYEAFFQSPIHDQIAERLHALLERFSATSHRRSLVTRMMDAGDFWSARDLTFLLRQVRTGHSADFALALLKVGRTLDSAGRERLSTALHSAGDDSALEKSLLFLLGMADADDQRDLIRLFEREYRMTDPVMRPHFPAGVFDRQNRIEYSNDSTGLVELSSTMTPAVLFGEEVVAGLALQEIHQRYRAGDAKTVQAIESLRAADQLQSQALVSSVFYRRLTTSGFLRAEGPSAGQQRLASNEVSNVVEVDFISRRKACARLLKK